MVQLVVWVSKHDSWFDGWPCVVAGHQAGVVFFDL